MQLRITKLIIGLFLCMQLSGQSVWTDAGGGSIQLDIPALRSLLARAPQESAQQNISALPALTLPLPDGSTVTFYLWQSPVMAPGLAHQFPQLQTFAGRSADGRSHIRCDLSPQGFHAMVFSPLGSWFIEPLDANLYEVFWKHDRQPANAFYCQVEETEIHPQQSPAAPYPIGPVLRTYRLAVSATGEYTQYHGGTVEGAMAAIVTTMHRVNGVYERDISARMILVDSNQLVVFTDPGTDPFSGGDGQIMNQNQNVTDSRIGNNNYDIGHVFHVGGGGVANLGAVCSPTRKARGFTSGSPPENDFFDIDYVAHEMGHQFGANHTMGNCQNMNDDTAFEPGSGTSIMGYAGLCGSNNVALNSDDLFHVISLEEMTQFAFFGNGNNCAVIDSTFNSPPSIVEMPPANLFIPISTPFELTTRAIDTENDSLTYSWEQYDLGPVTQLGQPTGSAPSFRVFRPSNSPTRVFPRLNDLVANISSINEVLPTYSRDLNFKVVVRDNHGFGGGVSWDEMLLKATSQAGPFVVQTANQATNWLAGSYQLIQWDVANTQLAPVSADSVVISLSNDGGFNYPYELSRVPNTGQAVVLLPDTLSGSQFRVKIKGLGHVFFDINNTNITIQAASEPTISATPLNVQTAVCAPNDAQYTLYLAGQGGVDSISQLAVLSLPEGLSPQLPQGPITLPTAVSLGFSGTQQLASGLYPLVLLAVADTITDTIRLELLVQNGLPDPPALLSPAQEAMGVSIRAPISWATSLPGYLYDLEIATDPDFIQIFTAVSGLSDTTFTPTFDFSDSTAYYWRVRSVSPSCGPGAFSEPYLFNTERILCRVYRPTTLPVPFTSLAFIISRIEVPDIFDVRDVNVRQIQGEYEGPQGELGFRLQGPGTPYYTLVPDSDCNIETSFNFNLDDEAAGNLPCPLNNGGSFKPNVPLSLYDGINAQGIWRLYLYDGGSDGQLSNWELEICGPAPLVHTKPEPRQEVSLYLYPQPAQDWLYIECPANQPGELQLFGISGGLVARHALSGSGSISLGSLPAGFYAYRWLSADGQNMAAGKLVIAQQ